MKKNEKLLDILGEVDDKHIPKKEDKKKVSAPRLAMIIGGAAAIMTAAAFALTTALYPDIFKSPIDVSPDTSAVTEVSGTEPPAADEGDIAPPADNTNDEDDKEIEVNVERKRKTSVVTDIEANSMYGSTALADTSFTIRSNTDISAEEMKNRISITPESEFTLLKQAECEYILSARTAFANGSLVKLSVEAEEGGLGDCYAFQIYDEFRIKQVYPADSSTSVSVSSGIEIEFSESVDEDTVKEHFSVSPELNGYFITRGKMLYFVPNDDMEEDVQYTVTVTPGIKSVSGSVLEEGREFSFITASRERFYTYNGISETFIEGDPVVIEVMNAASQDIDLVLYQYSSSDDYMAALSKYSEDRRSDVDTSGLTEVFTSCEKPMESSDSWRPSFVMLPYDLKEGCYVAKLTRTQTTVYYFIEMNPISVYSASLGDKSMFFINDTGTGAAAAGAEIILHTKDKDYTAKTNAEGVAELVTGDNCTRRDILEINYGGHRFIDSVTNYSMYKQTYSDMYFTYIYTDREAYQPTDVINVWGLIRPKRDGVKIPDELYVIFGDDIIYSDSPATGGVRERVYPNADGTFTASINITDWKSQYWRSDVALVDGSNDNYCVVGKRVKVLEYVKPTYTFDRELPEYLILPQNEPFKAKVSAKYFDGTPAAKLSFETNHDVVSGSMITDENGEINVELKAWDHEAWQPFSTQVEFRLTGIENTYQTTLDYIPTLSRDVMLLSEADKDAGTFTINTNLINLDKFPEYLQKEMSRDSYDGYRYYNSRYDILKGAPYDAAVTVEITRDWTEWVETGTYYNFIEKKTQKTYSYVSHTDNLGTYKVNTVNGAAVIEDLPLSKEGSYTFVMTYNDSCGRRTIDREYLWVSDNGYYWGNTEYRKFSLKSERYFKENQQIDFTLYEWYHTGNGDPSGKVFFIASQNDVLDAVVYNDVKFTYKTEDKCVPDFNVCGAYFDGRHVYPIEDNTLYFNTEDRVISLDVTTDKDKYDAGEEVTLTVYATDKNGAPVSGATVSLSVVDEAAFAIADQYVDIISDIYNYVWYRSPHQYCSYIQHVINGEPMGEKGGGDPEYGVRKDFRDNPFFGEARTDGSGKAVIKFRLADTITTWRATVQAVGTVNSRLYAGNTTSPIVATRPVFVTPIMLSEYVAGDDIAVSAKCVGIGDKDLITVTLSGGDEDKTESITPCATANFGKLPVGEYKVTFRASNGVNSDAMELPLSVVETKHEIWIEKDLDIDEISAISPTKWPVSVLFYNKDFLFSKEILFKLTHQTSSRVDMSTAANFAYSELGWDDSNYYETEVNAATRSGLAKLMENSESDLKTTALLCAAFPESVSRAEVVKAFTDRITNKNGDYTDLTDLTYCYMGLAALGEPVLADIKRLQSEYDDKLTDVNKLYLTAALALGGDFKSAYENYEALTTKMKFFEKRGELCAYLIDEEYTRLALISASVMDLPEAEALARGLIQRRPKYDAYSLELVVFIRNYVPKLSSEASFSYMFEGERVTKELDRYGVYRMMFDKEHFANADIRTESGSILVSVRYTGRTTELETAPTMNIQKNYSKLTGVTPGEVITVSIHTGSPYSTVEDIIPSGARFYSCDRYCDNVGQRVKLSTNESGYAEYKICAATSGEFTVEGAYAHDYVYNTADKVWEPVWGVTESKKMTVVKENESA